jgi:hypothetical protein
MKIMLKAPVSKRLLATCYVFVALSLWTGVSVSKAQQSSLPSSILKWVNGDELPGEIVSAANGKLTWRTPVLSQPISIGLDYLDSIRAAVPRDEKLPSDVFRFDLVGGHTVFGVLAGIDDDRVLIQSPRHGELTIDRRWVNRMARTNSAVVLDLIASGGADWKSIDRVGRQTNPPTSEWDLNKPGQVSTTTVGSRLYFVGDLPKVCRIELSVESKSMPRFALAYGTLAEVCDRNGAIEIDTWADELVAQSAARPDDFERLLTLTPTTKSLQLQIIWDRESGSLRVYGADSNLLSAMQAEKTERRPGVPLGLFLENKGNDLIVKLLRVSPWESSQEPQPTTNQDVVLTVSGRELRGKISRLGQDGLVKIVGADESESGVEPSQIVQLSLASNTPDLPTVDNCVLNLNDGTRLSGQFVAIRDGRAYLKTAFSKAEVAVFLEGLRELKLPRARVNEKQATSHVLRLGERQLHGTLSAAGNAIGWRPVGSSDVIPLRTNETFSIKRSVAGKRLETTSRFRDVLHLRN